MHSLLSLVYLFLLFILWLAILQASIELVGGADLTLI